MNITKDIVVSIQTIVVPAGKRRRIDQPGRYFLLVSNSSVTPVHVAIGNDGLSPWPVLFSARVEREEDYFERVTLYNPSGSPMTIEYVISNLIVESNATEVVGMVSVKDVSNDVYTYDAVRALPYNILMNPAPAVDKGGGLVGIPLTGQKFEVGEETRILGTVNYDGINYPVDASSSANEVVIPHAYVAETFDGVDDRIGPENPRKIAASSRKELIVYNTHATVNAWWGDQGISTRFLGPSTTKGIPIMPKTAFIITCDDDVYFMAEEAAGAAGCQLAVNALRTA